MSSADDFDRLQREEWVDFINRVCSGLPVPSVVDIAQTHVSAAVEYVRAHCESTHRRYRQPYSLRTVLPVRKPSVLQCSSANPSSGPWHSAEYYTYAAAKAARAAALSGLAECVAAGDNR